MSLENAAQRMKQRLDQQLAEFKEFTYSRLSQDSQVELKKWLTKLDEMQETQQFKWGFQRLRVECSLSYSDEDGNSIYEGGFKLTPNLLLKAIAAWEKDEPFLPKPFANS